MRTVLSFAVGLPGGIAINHYAGVPLVKKMEMAPIVPFIEIMLAGVIVFCTVRSITRLLSGQAVDDKNIGSSRFNLNACFFVPSFLFGIFLVFALSFN
jgi:hypothetical protein